MKHRTRRSHIVRVFSLVALTLGLISTTPSAHATVVKFPGTRPFSVYLPSSYSSNSPTPLVIALHGFAQSGAAFEKYLNLTPLAESRGFLYVAPNGTADSRGTRFWNATPECCDYQSPKVDDDAYILGLIDQISVKYNVDPARIYVIGHSNGGFMVNELACAHSSRFAAVINIAGGNFSNLSSCNPSTPINYLQLWGTKDVTYKENHMIGRYVGGAQANIKFWANKNGCSSISKSPAALDLDRAVVGKESEIIDYQGCISGVDVQFWKMNGVSHVPHLSPTFSSSMVDYLLAHKNSNLH